MVTGGIAPNFVGRLEPNASQLSFPWQVARHRLITDAVHAAGGRIALQILHAGRYAYHPLAVAPSTSRAPISRFRARGLTRVGRAADDRRLRALRGARAARRLRRRRDHGLGGLPHQPVRRAADQLPRRRMGRLVREPHPLSGRDRAPHARGGRPELHHHLPAVDARPGRRRQHVGRSGGARAGRRGRGRDDHQHGRRLARGAHPDDRDDGAARGVRVGDAAAEGRGRDSADHDQPHQRSGDGRSGARARRRRHGVDGAAVPRRPRVRQQGGGRIAPTRSTRASAATRRASTRYSRARSRRASSIRTRATRRCWSRLPLNAEEGGGRRRGAGRPRGGDDGGRARTPRDAVRCGRTRSAASSISRGAFRARKSSPRRCATSARGWRDSASSVALGTARGRRGPRGLRRRALATGIVPRVPGDSRHRPSEGRELRRDRRGSQGGGAHGRDRRRRRHRLRRRGIADRGQRAGRPPERWRARAIRRSPHFATSGASMPTMRRAADCKPAHEAAAAARRLWLLQRKESKVGAGLAKTTGWIRRALLKRRGVTMLAGVEYERIDDAGLHVDGRRRAAGARGRHDRDLRRTGAAPRSRRRADRRRHPPSAHRRRRRRARTRCEARDRAGHESCVGT